MKLDISKLKIQLQRFLPSVICAAIVLILSIVSLWVDFEDYIFWACSLYFFITSTWLFAAYVFLKESNQKFHLYYLIIGIAVFLGQCIYIYLKNNVISDSESLANFALLVMVVSWGFVLPYLGKNKEIPLYNFSGKILGNICISTIVFLVFWGSASLLMASFKWLFDFHFGEKAFFVACFVSMFLGYLIFIYLNPEKEELFDCNIYKSNLSKIALFVLVPILSVYLIVLYVYALKILFTFSLPKGGVSYLVSVVVAIILLLQILLFYNVNNKEDKTYFLGIEIKKLLRFFALLSIPMLIFMTIGIIKRFVDYGITAPRLYLITLNIWYYFVILYFVVKKDFRLSIVFLTLLSMFFVTSFGPWNYISLDKKYRHDIPRNNHNGVLKIEEPEIKILVRDLDFYEDNKNIDIPENAKSFKHFEYKSNTDVALDFDESFISKLKLESKNSYQLIELKEPLKVYSLDKKQFFVIYHLNISLEEKKIVGYNFSGYCFE